MEAWMRGDSKEVRRQMFEDHPRQRAELDAQFEKEIAPLIHLSVAQITVELLLLITATLMRQCGCPLDITEHVINHMFIRKKTKPQSVTMSRWMEAKLNEGDENNNNNNNNYVYIPPISDRDRAVKLLLSLPDNLNG
eukprot:sb/3474544/